MTSDQVDLTSGATGSSSDPGAQAWFFYQNTVNTNRALTAEQVCQRATQDATTNPDAAQVRNLCEANSTSQALAYTFGVGVCWYLPGEEDTEVSTQLVVKTDGNPSSVTLPITFTPIRTK